MRLELKASSHTDIETLVESSIEDILFDDTPTLVDICIASLF